MPIMTLKDKPNVPQIKKPSASKKPAVKRPKAKKPARKATKAKKPQDHASQIATGENEAVKAVRKVGPNKKPGTLSYKTKQLLDLAVNHGVDAKDAYALVNGKAPSSSTLTGVRKKVAKYALTAPSMVKLAHQAVKDTLQGKEARYDAVKVFSNGKREAYQEVIVPSYTNKLAAASMIFDRDQPIKGQQGSQAPSFTQVNMNVYLNPSDRFTATETATETKTIELEPHE